jgi:hypothetical protein
MKCLMGWLTSVGPEATDGQNRFNDISSRLQPLRAPRSWVKKLLSKGLTSQSQRAALLVRLLPTCRAPY